MALFDLLGRTWAMGVIWQLQGGPYTFRALQERCESISPSILNSRIKDLSQAGIVERSVDGYCLTAKGEELIGLILPLADWSFDWAESVFNYTKPSGSPQ
jgi:DNA-binding HxlR family transcriptional regulator